MNYDEGACLVSLLRDVPGIPDWAVNAAHRAMLALPPDAPFPYVASHEGRRTASVTVVTSWGGQTMNLYLTWDAPRAE